MVGLGSQRMLPQLGRMSRDGAAMGPLRAFMLLIQVRSHQPQCLGLRPPVPTLFMASREDGVLGTRGWGQQEGGGRLFFTSFEAEPAFVQQRQSGHSIFSKHWHRPSSLSGGFPPAHPPIVRRTRVPSQISKKKSFLH